MQDFVFAFAKSPEIPVSPFLQLAKVPRNGRPAWQQDACFSPSGNDVAEDVLCHFVRSLVGTPQIIGVEQDIPSLWLCALLVIKKQILKRHLHHRNINPGTKLACAGTMLRGEKQFGKS